MKGLLTTGLVLAAVVLTRAQAPLVLRSGGEEAPDSVTLLPANPLTTYGFIDAYYGYDVSAARGHDRPGFLYSHDRQNEFTINNAVLGLRYQDEQVRGALGLQAGTYVTANYAAEDPVFQHLYEAYAGFRPFHRAWLDVGLFPSHLGFESAISKDNWTLTRSLMAENSPYYEAGARLIYEASAKLTLTALVLNGWQNIRETNQNKAFGTQLQWKPTDKLLLNSSSFYGNEQPQDSAIRRRLFHNFYVRYAATKRLSLALVYDLGRQQAGPGRSQADIWHTGALLARHQLARQWAAALRAEYFQAENGVVINSLGPARADQHFCAYGASLNLDYAPSTLVLVRLEGRVLAAQKSIFERKAAAPTDRYGNATASMAFSF